MMNEIRKDRAGMRLVLVLALLTLFGTVFSGCATVAKVGTVFQDAGTMLTDIGGVMSAGPVADITHGTDAVGITSTAPVVEPAK